MSYGRKWLRKGNQSKYRYGTDAIALQLHDHEGITFKDEPLFQDYTRFIVKDGMSKICEALKQSLRRPRADNFGDAVFLKAAEAIRSEDSGQETYCVDRLFGEDQRHERVITSEAETLAWLRGFCKSQVIASRHPFPTLDLDSSVQSQFFGPRKENGFWVSGISFTWRIYWSMPDHQSIVCEDQAIKAEDEEETKKVPLCEVTSAILIKALETPEVVTRTPADEDESATDTVASASSSLPCTRPNVGSTRAESDLISVKTENTQDVDLQSIPSKRTARESSSGSHCPESSRRIKLERP